VIEELRSAIVSGRIAASEPLRETALAQMLGTGRSAIREAIRHLVGEGLVEYRLNHGAFVRVISPRDAYDVYLAREAIEVAAVNHALAAPEPLRLDELERCLHRIILAAAAQPPNSPAGTELIAADLDFHRVMVGLAGSLRLTRAHETLAAEAQMLMHHQPSYELTHYAGDHRILYEALCRRDPDTAAKVRDHLRLSADLIADEINRISGSRTTPSNN
jgi:DNA-binding GntR family transcriptional regulator